MVGPCGRDHVRYRVYFSCLANYARLRPFAFCCRGFLFLRILSLLHMGPLANSESAANERRGRLVAGVGGKKAEGLLRWMLTAAMAEDCPASLHRAVLNRGDPRHLNLCEPVLHT